MPATRSGLRVTQRDLAVALAYIDKEVELRRAERDDLTQQIRWLEEERRSIQAAAKARK